MKYVEPEESEEEEVAGSSSKKLNQSLKQAQANVKKNVLAAADEDDSEDMENGLSSFASFNQNPKPMLKPAIVNQGGAVSR
jgi:hypothetical protein